jgi:hypothetical protein
MPKEKIMISFEQDATSEDSVNRVPVDAEFVPPFRLRLMNNDANEVDRDGVLEGIVTNTSYASWTVNHQIGLRHFRDVQDRVIGDFQLRAKLFPQCIEPGEKAYFRFAFAALTLPTNAAVFTLDVVEEGVSWLHEQGSTPVEFRLRGIRMETEALWTELLCDVRANADPLLAKKLELIEKAIRLASCQTGGMLARHAPFAGTGIFGRQVSCRHVAAH